ncbi:MAG: hypothetical protein ABI789_10635 [Usitatibacter sp.]
MKARLVPLIAILAVAVALPACSRPNTAYNNSGASATPGSVNTTNLPATPTSAATPDTSSPAAAAVTPTTSTK